MLLFLYFILIHWVADFVLQTNHMATRKSTSNYYLTMHITFYTVATMLGWWIIFLITGQHATKLQYFASFSAIFIMHWLTDYVTSRITSKLYAKGDYHNFFVVIGFDQILHYAQIYLVYNFLILKPFL